MSTGFSAPGTLPDRPRDAATVMLLRDRAGGGLEVLLVRRHARSGFMAGAFVFPGGKVDPSDADPRLLARTADEERLRAERALEPTPGRSLDREAALALHVAAVREVFEEAGILLSRDRVGRSGPSLAERRRQLEREGLAAVLEAEAASLDLGALAYWAHWITPSAEPKRFDTRFFLARHPAGQTAEVDRHEATEHVWLTPEEAIGRHESGAIFLPPPTWITLRELAAFSSVDQAFEGSRRRSIAAILPKVALIGEEIAVVLPWDPRYAELEGEALPHPGGHGLEQEVSRVVLRDQRWIALRG
jgi:8-oxo-dGTP pyrophosphatase MutT (NUDIX family)